MVQNKQKFKQKNLWKIKDFKTGNTTKSSVSHNILTNHTFDFKNSAIFAFIHDKNKRRMIEACFIAHHNTISQRQRFFKISLSAEKIFLKGFKTKRLAPLFLDISKQ